MVLDDLVERLPDKFDLEDIRGRTDDITPYIMVAIQESERMNVLLSEMKRSLAELDLGLKGDLTMSDPMEKLMNALADGSVAPGWAKLAYPSPFAALGELDAQPAAARRAAQLVDGGSLAAARGVAQRSVQPAVVFDGGDADDGEAQRLAARQDGGAHRGD